MPEDSNLNTHIQTHKHTAREHTVCIRVGATERENTSTFQNAGANSVKSKLLNVSNRNTSITFNNDTVVFLLL